MRVFIAGLGTETNMFVPFPTGRRGYEEFGVYRGTATKHPPKSFTGPLHVWRRMAEARSHQVIEGLPSCCSCRAASTPATTTRWAA